VKPILIAELAKVGKGDKNKYKTLIDHAHLAGFNAVKFQFYDRNALNKSHPNYQKNYDCWLSLEDIMELKEYAKNYKMDSWCSIFDSGSLNSLVGRFKTIKIPSTFLSNTSLISDAIYNFDNIHISTGFHDRASISSLVSKYKKLTNKKNIVIYHCVSEYPTPDCNLKLDRLYTLKANGFSYHGCNKLAVLYSILAGAEYIELHFNSFSCTSWQWSIPMIQGLVRSIDELQMMFKDGGMSGEEKKMFEFYKKEFKTLC
jgi:N-acetylneuraminate synthase